MRICRQNMECFIVKHSKYVMRRNYNILLHSLRSINNGGRLFKMLRVIKLPIPYYILSRRFRSLSTLQLAHKTRNRGEQNTLVPTYVQVYIHI